MSGNKVGNSPSVWPQLSSFASEGEEFERRTDGDEKESEVGQKRLSFVEGARGNDRSSLVSPETDLTC